MREFSMMVLGLLLFFFGFLGFLAYYSIGRIEDILSMLDLNPSIETSTFVAFSLVTISGMLFISYTVGKGLGWRYRLFAFLGSVLCAVSSAIFFTKLVVVGPDWVGREMLGIGGKGFTLLSAVITLVPFLSFLGGFLAILSEMEI